VPVCVCVRYAIHNGNFTVLRVREQVEERRRRERTRALARDEKSIGGGM